MSTFTKSEIAFNRKRRFSIIANWSNPRQWYESQEALRITGFSSCASVRAFTIFFISYGPYIIIFESSLNLFMSHICHLNQASACTKMGSFSKIDSRFILSRDQYFFFTTLFRCMHMKVLHPHSLVTADCIWQ